MSNPDVLAAVHDEARADLDRLVSYATKKLAEIGADQAAAEMTQGLLAQPSWDRMMIATVLGAALVRLAEVGE